MRYKITIEYDGTPFCGWQRQDGVDTVQQRLEESILPLSKKSITIYGSGRTDTGVHALAQVAHFDLDNEIDCFRVQECMNAYLREVPICVLSVQKVNNEFDARFSAVERTY
ncbi:MAG: tRNA pseudouridine(38-40) synthase TruA, partial [Alphaproteobacteria bacterium]|nr:tRNA pseudouridine(38-40) synthase TruA [Alphaproteobacteria bacterium]